MTTILHIEDDESLRKLYNDELSEEGYTVYSHNGHFSIPEELEKSAQEKATTAKQLAINSGKSRKEIKSDAQNEWKKTVYEYFSDELTDLLDSIGPHLVIIDVKLQIERNTFDINGLDLLVVIKQLKDIPVIISTAFDIFKNSNSAIAADSYVVKSFDFRELKREIKHSLAAYTINLENLDFGRSKAESDILVGLRSYYLKTASYNRVKSGKKSIILGNRGSGKSAILKILEDDCKKNDEVVIPLLPEEYSYEFFKEIMISEKGGSWAKRGAYAASWKYLILVTIMKSIVKSKSIFKNTRRIKESFKRICSYVKDNHIFEDNDKLRLLVDYLRRIQEIKIGKFHASITTKEKELDSLYKLEEINILIDDIVVLCQNTKIFVLVDDLDRGWNNSEDSIYFVEGLVQASGKINEIHINLRVVVSLRQELFDVIPYFYTEAEKLEDEIEKLSWNKTSLRKIIANRIRHCITGLIEHDSKSCWNYVFKSSEQIKEGDTFEYIINRTLCRPRELIQFCRIALEKAHDIGSNFVPFAAIGEAEIEYSEKRTKAIAAEYQFQYPGLIDIFETFRGKTSVHKHDDLSLILGEIEHEQSPEQGYKWILQLEYYEIVKILLKIGFLSLKFYPDVSKRNNIYNSNYVNNINKHEKFYKVHPMFHKYLDIQE